MAPPNYPNDPIPSPYNPRTTKTTQMMSAPRYGSATDRDGFEKQRLYFNKRKETERPLRSPPSDPSIYSQASISSLRPPPLRLGSSSSCNPTPPTTPALTISNPSPQPQVPHPSLRTQEQLQTQDPALLALTNHSRNNSSTSINPDTSISTLLTLLRNRLSSLPLESGPIALQFSKSLSNSPSNDFKDKCTRVLRSYASTLTQTKLLLEMLIEMGEELIREEEESEKRDTTGILRAKSGVRSEKEGEQGRRDVEEGGTKTNRQIWWFAARTVLAEADQYL